MRTVKNPDRASWELLTQRPAIDHTTLFDKVQSILDEVSANGDTAVKGFTEKFDGVKVDSLEVTAAEFQEAESLVSTELKEAIQVSIDNVRRFHESQKETNQVVETMPGVKCWRKSVGIDKVGLYIPGGTAPLFSTIVMLGVPALIAGCKEIILCTPPNKEGAIHPAILYTAKKVGVTRLFKAGGAQAIAAMAYGTESVPKVYKIFGPGNQYVTAAKQLVNMGGTGIDMPAGPSELAVYADETSVPKYMAADLLSQTEHGVDSQVILVSTSETILNETLKEVNEQVEALPRKDIAKQALVHSQAILFDEEKEAIDFLNLYAAEHLILAVDRDEEIGEQISNAGSVFMGHYSPESVGDYASGTNHTLPTNGYARMYSGVSLDSFITKITYQKLSSTGLKNIGKYVEEMAAEEQLEAHKNAVTIRLKDI